MECEIKGTLYRIAKLSVFEQLKVSRKLLPLLTGVVTEFTSVRESMANKDIDGVMSAILPPVADALANMDDADVEAILFPCLAVVSRQQGKNWIPVCQQQQIAFDDIDLLTMLQLVARVVADSLGNFLPDFPISGMNTQTAD